MITDNELLALFGERGDRDALTSLARRHRNLVYSVAFRQVGEDADLAKDACRKVFSSLAKKAGELKERRVLVGWLFKATCLESKRVRRGKSKSVSEDKVSWERIELSEGDERWGMVRPLLDRAIRRLDRIDRDAICCRFIGGRDLEEMAELWGIDEGAAKARSSNALQNLIEGLRKRGIVTDSLVLSGALKNHASMNAPEGFARSLTAAVKVKAQKVRRSQDVSRKVNTLKLVMCGALFTTFVLGILLIRVWDEANEKERRIVELESRILRLEFQARERENDLEVGEFNSFDSVSNLVAEDVEQ